MHFEVAKCNRRHEGVTWALILLPLFAGDPSGVAPGRFESEATCVAVAEALFADRRPWACRLAPMIVMEA